MALYLLLAMALVFPFLGSFPAQAASTITFRAAATANNAAGSTSLTIARPSGVLAGDVLVAQVVIGTPSVPVTPPSGWHGIRAASSATVVKVVTYYKVAGSSEPAAYRWTFGTSLPATGGIVAFTGVDATAPIDVSSGKANTGRTAAFTQVTTRYPGDMLLAFVGVAGNTAVTQPTGFTEAFDRQDVATVKGRSAEASYARKSAAGTTTVPAAQEVSLSVANATQLIALRPAGIVATATPAPFTIAVVGDMECQTATCQGTGVSNLVAQIHPAFFVPDGDLTWIGSYYNFMTFYNPAFGQFKSISHPAIGNHDGLQGYYDYWNGSGVATGRAGTRGKGWYSFSKNGWHFVVLNSNCVDGVIQVSCAPGSPQINWLNADLTNHPALCTMAFMHIPYYTSGPTQYPALKTIFQTLYNHHVDVLVTGHTHYYQRYYPQNANAQRVAGGVTEFVVGTGGGDLSYVQSKPSAPNEAAQIGQSFGVLKMVLSGGSYSFRWMAAPGYTGSDSGSGLCH
jgi:hypothetical protein